MVLKNVLIYTQEKEFKAGTVWIEGDRIEQIWLDEHIDCRKKTKEYESECIDGNGAYLIPGMIDIHTHGCKGYDFCDGTIEAVREMAEYLATIGVTTFAPATMTLPVEQLEQVLRNGAKFVREKQQGKLEICADLAGINMEGPFISSLKKGAQEEAYIIPASVELFEQLQQAANGLIRYVGIAPEECDAMEFVRRVQKSAKVSIAHSNADYETAMKAFRAGVRHVTHLYNAMPELKHREPGIVGAVTDCRQVEAELICDGVHIHPAVIRATFAMLGAERIIMISDSMRAAGMPDGDYELGGQKVSVQGRLARLEDGTIAGSVTSLPDCFRYAVREAGVPLEEAVACVTINPARSLGIDREYGSIALGRKADLVLLGRELEVLMVVKDGCMVK